MEVVLFRIRTRLDVDQDEYGAAFAHMMELVHEIPGFVGFEGFTGEDGTELAIASFENESAIRAWRDHPEHAATRERGRHEFFDAYDITVATVSRHYSWARDPARSVPAIGAR